jgi:beta-glucosidase
VQTALGATYTATAQALVSSAFLTTPDGNGQGLLAEYFDNPDFQGQPKLRRAEPRVYFDANMEEKGVMAAVHTDKYSVRWTGTLTPPATGDYVIAARTGQWNREGKIKLFLDDKEMNPSGPAGARPAGLGPGQGQVAGPGGRRGGAPPMQLEGGRKYVVKVEYSQNGRGGGAELNWMPPAAVLLAEAVKVARDSDVALVFVGLNGAIEGEGHDRSTIDLPEPQENLVTAMIATGKPVVVILTSGSAVAVNSAAESAAAVLSAWYGGEEAGTAIAETLAGINNPAGRLPVTFYKGTDQLPEFTDYSMKGRTYRYFKGEPLYPFGFGLSYSSFQYSGLSANRTPKGAEIHATVKNTSTRDGDEVVQLYMGSDASEGAAVRSLKGFQRVHLRAGQSQQVIFTVNPEDLPTGKVEISVGGGQPLGTTPHVKGTL